MAVKKNQRHLVRVKAEGFDEVLIGPVELMKPPKGAGPSEGAWRPKSLQARKAMRGKLGKK